MTVYTHIKFTTFLECTFIFCLKNTCYAVKANKGWRHLGGQIVKRSKNFMRWFIMLEEFRLHQKLKTILIHFRPDLKANPSKYSWDWKFSMQKVSGTVRNFMFILAMTAFFTVNMYRNLPWHLSHAVNHRHMLHIICGNNLFAFIVPYSGLSVDLCHTMRITISGFVLFIFLVLPLLTCLLQFSKVCS